MFSERVRTVLWWVAALGLIGVAVIYVWPLFSQRRMERVARSFVRAVFEGDGKTFCELILPRDQAALELTPEKCQRLLDEVVLPKFRGCKVVGWDEPHADYRSGFGHTAVNLVCDGKATNFGVNVGWVTGVGGTVSWNNFLKLLWDWDYHRRYGRLSSGYLESCVDGVRQDLDRLERTGIKGWVSIKGHAISWREWLADAERRLAKEREARSGQPTIQKVSP